MNLFIFTGLVLKIANLAMPRTRLYFLALFTLLSLGVLASTIGIWVLIALALHLVGASMGGAIMIAGMAILFGYLFVANWRAQLREVSLTITLGLVDGRESLSMGGMLLPDRDETPDGESAQSPHNNPQ